MSELDLIREFLEDPQITDVLLDGHVSLMVERVGVLEKASNPFDDETGVE
ncbi:MAG: hypothetical protein RIS19_345, partial [Actinomycetota bacterium]